MKSLCILPFTHASVLVQMTTWTSSWGTYRRTPTASDSEGVTVEGRVGRRVSLGLFTERDTAPRRPGRVPGAEHHPPASAPGRSCTVTNGVLLEKLPTGSEPQIQSPPPHCNRFRLILCLFVVLCLMQLHKFPGLSPKEPE